MTEKYDDENWRRDSYVMETDALGSFGATTSKREEPDAPLWPQVAVFLLLVGALAAHCYLNDRENTQAGEQKAVATQSAEAREVSPAAPIASKPAEVRTTKEDKGARKQ